MTVRLGGVTEAVVRVRLIVLAALVAGVASLALAGTATAAQTETFPNSASIGIPDPGSNAPGAASPYPSPIMVSGLTGTISHLTVTLSGIHYLYSQDIQALLVGPTGKSLVLFASVGSNDQAQLQGPSNGVNVTLDDTATNTYAYDAELPVTGSVTMKPADDNFTNGTANFFVPPSDTFPSPAPSGPYGHAASTGTDTLDGTFGASNPNGTWNLYVTSANGGDGTGSISGGWSLTITAGSTAAATTTSLTSGNNPSFTTAPNNSVTLTANVSSTSTVNEGTVDFTDGGTTISGCGAAAVSGGVAQCTTTFSTEGSHQIEAQYSDSSGNFGASNATISQEVDDHTVISGSSYCNAGPITLGGSSAPLDANPFPSKVFVSGLGGTTSHLTITLKNVSAPFAQDMDVLLVGPNNQDLVLVGWVGPDSGGTLDNVTLTLDDSASSTLAQSAAWASANSSVTSKPVNYSTLGEAFGSAPTPYGEPASVGTATLGQQFNGSSPNGTWELYAIGTGGSPDAGATIAGGWCANITTNNVPATTTVLTSDNNPSFTSVPGNGVALTATVASTGSEVSEGTVDFTDGGSTISGCGAVPVTSGGATCTTSFSTEGSHSLQALYSGSSNFGPSNGTLSQQVDDHTTVSGSSFCNAGTIVLNNPTTPPGDASPYPSHVFVSGLPGSLTDLTVTLKGVSYPFSQDIDALLVGPSGQSLILAADAGPNSNGAVSNVTLTLDDAASGTLSQTGSWGAANASVTSKPFNYGGLNETWGPPAPAGPYGNPGPAGGGTDTLGGTFDATNPNGTWSLYVIVTGSDGTGSIAGGWCVNTTIQKAALTLGTQVSPPSATIGDPTTDTATLGGVPQGADAPTGTVTFNAYGPNDPTCSNTPAFTTTIPLTGAGTSTSSGNFTPSSLGTYLWTASYSGDSNYSSQTTSCNDPNETVTVTEATPSLATTASPSVVVGGAISDTATLSGGDTPTGTITFKAYGPNDPTCANSPAFTSTVTANGNGAYNSGNFTATAPGTYQFVATYAGDPNNTAAISTCGAPGESVLISQASPSLSTTASSSVILGGTISDDATLSGGVNPTGIVTFLAFGPNDPTCSNAPAFTAAVPVNGNNTSSSGNFTPSAAGTYQFVAIYSGDTNNAPAASTCGAPGESVTVLPFSPSLTSQASPALTTAGNPITDTATLSGMPQGAAAPTGTVTFNAYGPNDPTCSSTPAFTTTIPLTGAGTNTSSGNFTPTSPGTYLWTASYSGDSNYSSQTTACNDPDETVTVTQAAPSLATTASSGVPLGGTINDTATLSGGDNPSGTIIFNAYGPNDPTCSRAPVFSVAVPVTGNGAYDSGNFSPVAAGLYQFVATYAGDPNNIPVPGSCGAAGESVAVGKVSPSLSTTASSSVTIGGAISDTAALTGVPPGANAPTGSVTFSAYAPNDPTCSSTPAFTTTIPLTGAGTNTSSGNFTPTSPGTYRWTASYSGDSNYSSQTTTCNDPNETVTVTQATPSLATTASSAVALGGTINDSAALSGGDSPTGTITFSVYGPNDPSCTNNAAFTATISVNGDRTYSSGNFNPTAAGTYQFVATYNGDTNNSAESGSCGATGESVVVGKASPSLSTTASSSVTGGNSITDTAALSGVPHGADVPTGSITFNAYGPNDPNCSNQPAFTATIPLTGAGTGASSGSFTPTTAGTYRWTASYGGDSNYSSQTTTCNEPNESATVTQAATHITLTSSLNPSGPGRPVTFTATISGMSPTGAVTFKDGSSTLGTEAVGARDTATLTTSSLGAGSHAITAVYGGDANNGGSTSNTLTQVVVPSDHAGVSHITVRPDGTVTFKVTLPGPGVLNVLETAWLDNYMHAGKAGAHAARMLQPAQGRFVFARTHVGVHRARTITVTVKPNSAGRRLLARHQYTPVIRLWVSFTPAGGKQRDYGFYGLHLPGGPAKAFSCAVVPVVTGFNRHQHVDCKVVRGRAR